MVTLCLLASVLCAGCRFSSVIRETVYDQTAEEVDEDADPIVNIVPVSEEQNEDEHEDEQTEERAEEDIERLLSVYDGDATALGTEAAATLTFDATGVDFGEAQTKASGGKGSADDGNAGQDAASSEGDAGEGSSSSGKGSGTDKGANGQVTGTKNYESLPTDVGTIAAPGEYAAVVCTLGGADALAATSRDFAASAAQVSPGWKAAARAPVVFTDDGDGTLAKGGLATLEGLHEEGACDAILVESTDVVGDELTSLKEAGISVYTVSRSSLDDVRSTVSAVGKLLKDATGGASVNLANKYGTLCDQVISTCSHDSGQYTLYVTNWDAKAVWTVTSNRKLAQGVGMAATSFAPTAGVSDLLSSAGLANLTSLGKFSAFAKKTGLYWVSPFNKASATVEVSAGTLDLVGFTSVNNGAVNGFRELTLYTNTSGDYSGFLGSEHYTALIARDKDVAQGLIASRDSDDGAYAPQPALDLNVANNAVGIKDDDNNYVQTFIGDGTKLGSKSAECFKVYTAPHGVYSSWTDGSLEGVLFIAWANSKFYQTYTNSQLKSLVTEFYQDFYGASSVDYDAIMEDAGE